MYTKGPWVKRKWDGDYWPDKRVSICDDEGKALFINARYADNVDANANLISAAPELLEALETLLGDYKDACDEWVDDAQVYGLELIDMAEKVIAKAKGEG